MTDVGGRDRVIVIGGGPAGLMAAGSAAASGARVVLLERGLRPGRKLRLTGKGRCNITNTADVHAFVKAFAPNGRFLYPTFSRWFRDDLLALLRDLGVETKTERGGRVFPVSDTAIEVSEALEGWLHRLGVTVKTNTRARGAWVADGRLAGVDVYGGRIDGRAVVVATGGMSYPATGSTGDGYAMAASAGHRVVPPRPCLCPLVVRERWVADLAGLALRNVEARLLPAIGGKAVAAELGEMLFTHDGVSGPIVLTVSRWAAGLLAGGGAVLSIDLKPALNHEQLRAKLIREFAATTHLGNYLRTLLPRSLADAFPTIAGLDPHRPLNKVTAEERGRLIERLKDFRLSVMALGRVEEAIVTAGGVDLREVEPATMMSKLQPGLFFAGEVLDIDAETGGYNLQAAFSTGWVAGKAAAAFLAQGAA